MKVLVLGGYGLIGSAIVGKLSRDGFEVTGLGRGISAARRRLPGVHWVRADISRLTRPDDWKPLISGVSVVVNAAGALQDGLGDRLADVQLRAMVALYAACQAAGNLRVVQISAVGADDGADTAFLQTKGAADLALSESGLPHTILRPGLVLSPTAYGGTAMLRALAAFPGVMPLILADRSIQTVAIHDVADAVSLAVQGRHSGTLDLVEDQVWSVAEVAGRLRAWLGLPQAPVVNLPNWIGRLSGAVADGLGWLGWRSPLRSTALRAIETGVTGDPEPWRQATGKRLASLEQTLAVMPAGVQELWFARLWLLKPVILGGLSLFWIASGLIGLFRQGQAAQVLTTTGFDPQAASAFVLLGSLADLTVGVAVLVKPTARFALLGMIGLSLAYLGAASLFTPDLWVDPLGPLVKVAPGLILCLVALAILDDR